MNVESVVSKIEKRWYKLLEKDEDAPFIPFELLLKEVEKVLKLEEKRND